MKSTDSLLQMYGLIWLTDLRNKLGRVDLLIMLTSALCHDLDHPGYNNVYQVASPPHHTSHPPHSHVQFLTDVPLTDQRSD